jgi:hypothetical protein
VADEVQVAWRVDGSPDAAKAAWQQQPRAALDGFELVDEAYNALTYEASYLSGGAKVVVYGTFGVGALFKDNMRSIWRLNVAFTPAEEGGTQITIVGRAPEHVREALAAEAGWTR